MLLHVIFIAATKSQNNVGALPVVSDAEVLKSPGTTCFLQLDWCLTSVRAPFENLQTFSPLDWKDFTFDCHHGGDLAKMTVIFNILQSPIYHHTVTGRKKYVDYWPFSDCWQFCRQSITLRMTGLVLVNEESGNLYFITHFLLYHSLFLTKRCFTLKRYLCYI